MSRSTENYARLIATPPQPLPVHTITTDEAFQPRAASVVKFRKRAVVATLEETWVRTLCMTLEASNTAELDPILCAEVGGKLYVVDGHHRLEAYRQAKRATIPARFIPLSQHDAVMVSKVANFMRPGGLPMDNEQTRDCCWYEIIEATKGGTLPLPGSLREWAGRYGAGADKQTVARMMDKLKMLDPAQYAEGSRAPGMQYPRWKYARNPKARDSGWTPASDEERAKDLARKIGALIHPETPEVVRRALQMLTEDETEGAD